jgi:hypothetical protein
MAVNSPPPSVAFNPVQLLDDRTIIATGGNDDSAALVRVDRIAGLVCCPCPQPSTHKLPIKDLVRRAPRIGHTADGVRSQLWQTDAAKICQACPHLQLLSASKGAVADS